MAEVERADPITGAHAPRSDVIAGVAVAVVLIPQSLAYAELAGLPADRGLVTAAVAAVVGALLGSSPFLQTGPTALASLLTFGILTGLGAQAGSDRFVALAALLAVMAGLFRVVLGAAKLGRVSYLLSPPVIAGLATGAGLLIMTSQLPALLGVSASATSPLVGGVQALVNGGWSTNAMLVGGATIVVMAGAQRVSARVPGALLAVIAGMALAAVLDGDVEAVTLDVPALGIAFDTVGVGDVANLLVPSLVVAVIGFSEAAAIARRLAARGRERWSATRELLGQGASCLIAGAAGGFPTSGSFSRSALARMSGARTRLAGVVAGVITLAVLPVTQWVPAIPRPTLAALVAVAGASLIDPGPFRRLYANARLQFLVAVGTLAATLTLAPRIDVAVLVGVILAVSAHLFREERVHVRSERRGDTVHVEVDGVVFYVSAPRLVRDLAEILSEHPDVSNVVMDLSGAGRIDVSGAVALAESLDEFEESGAEVHVVGMSPPTEKVMRRLLGDRLAEG